VETFRRPVAGFTRIFDAATGDQVDLVDQEGEQVIPGVARVVTLTDGEFASPSDDILADMTAIYVKASDPSAWYRSSGTTLIGIGTGTPGAISSTSISDSTASGRALLTAASPSVQRGALGLGSAALSSSDDFAPVAHVSLAAGAHGMSSAGAALVAAGSAAAQTALLSLATTAAKGLMPATGTPSGKFLKDDLTFATPAGSAQINGTTGLYAPALLQTDSPSSTVAAVIEAFSSSLTKDGKRVSPENPEQGVVQLGHGAYDLERTLRIDLTGTVSRHALRIRGQHAGATIIRGLAASSTANFKSGGIWRMIWLTADATGKFDRFRMEDLELTCYFTQNGDGTTALSDSLRMIDTDYLQRSHFENVRLYWRNLTHLSTDQIGLYLKRAYYGSQRGVAFTGLGKSAAGNGMNGATTTGWAGVGMVLDNCNSYQASSFEAAACNVGVIFRNELGSVVNGFHMENINRGFHFEDSSVSCRALNGYLEFHYLDNGNVMLPRDQQAIATFSATTRDNLVTLANGQSLPRIKPWVDRSPDQSNKVVVQGLKLTNAYSSVALPATRKLSSVTVTGVTGSPAKLPSQRVIEVAWPGNYGEAVYWVVPVPARMGSVRVTMAVKRISGDGMMVPQLTSAGLAGSNSIGTGYLLDPFRRHENASGSVPDIDIAATGNSWSSGSSGQVTLTFKRQHLLQPGMRVLTAGTVGTIAAGTALYVRSVTSETVAVFGVATGTLADPGSITTGSVTLPSDMYGWLGQEDCTRDYLVIDKQCQISFNVIGLALDGSNILTITLDRTCASAGIVNGSALHLWGFNDSRIDGVDYDALSADISGSTIKLNAVGALAGLDTTSAASNGLDQTTAVYGKIGFRSINVALIGKTTGTAACVWRVTPPIVQPGVHQEGTPVAEGVEEVFTFAASDETTALTTGTGKVTFRMPYAFTHTRPPRASVNTAQASGSLITVDVNKNGTTILSTKLTIDNTEKTSVTAATPPVLSSDTIADDDEITVDIDAVDGATAAKGLKITFYGVRG